MRMEIGIPTLEAFLEYLAGGRCVAQRQVRQLPDCNMYDIFSFPCSNLVAGKSGSLEEFPRLLKIVEPFRK